MFRDFPRPFCIFVLKSCKKPRRGRRSQTERPDFFGQRLLKRRAAKYVDKKR